MGVSALLFSFAGGCDKPVPGYFPLMEGYRWRYQVTQTTMDGSRQQRYLLSNDGMQARNGKNVHVRRSLNGTELYYQQDDTGILYLGSADTSGVRPVYHEDRRRVLAFPLLVGTAWQEKTVTRLLKRTSASSRQTVFRIVADVPMEGKIVALNDSVNVPAGTFYDCIKVEMQGSTFRNAGDAIGLTLVNVTETSWYAPGVGLVKLERLEKTQNNMLKQGSLSLALEQFWPG